MDMIDFLEPMYKHFLLKTFNKTEREMREDMKLDGKSKVKIDEHMNDLYEKFVLKAVREGGI